MRSGVSCLEKCVAKCRHHDLHQLSGRRLGHLSNHLDKHAERPNVSKASPFTIHSYQAGSTSLCISEALDLNMPPEADFAEWLRLRAPAANKITIVNTSAQEVWLFAKVLLAVSGSGRLGVSKPPVALIAGSCNMLTAMTFHLNVFLQYRQRASSGLTADDDHSVLQSFRFCQLLSSTLTTFSAIEYISEGPLELDGVRHLSALTKLTDLP